MVNVFVLIQLISLFYFLIFFFIFYITLIFFYNYSNKKNQNFLFFNTKYVYFSFKKKKFLLFFNINQVLLKPLPDGPAFMKENEIGLTYQGGAHMTSKTIVDKRRSNLSCQVNC
jgi:hypothetical protein